jgi:hypothetical protein
MTAKVAILSNMINTTDVVQLDFSSTTNEFPKPGEPPLPRLSFDGRSLADILTHENSVTTISISGYRIAKDDGWILTLPPSNEEKVPLLSFQLVDFENPLR